MAEKQDERQKVDDENMETKLLEANKKRLLRQQDWVGIALCKPVDVRFSSSKENGRIGKRGKASARRGATTHRNSNLQPAGRLLQPTNDEYAFTSGALRHNDGDIRIRIGTDALTTTASSTQPHDCVQSQASSDSMLFEQASSDPMLFDHEPRRTAQQKRSHDARIAPFDASILAKGSRLNIDYHPHGPDKQTQIDDGDAQQGEINCSEPTRLGDSHKYNQAELAMAVRYVSAVETMNTENEAFAPDCQIMQHVEGIERPLRLIFGDLSRPADARGRIKLQDNSVGEKEQAHKADAADCSRLGYMYQINDENGQRIIDEALTRTRGAPWKPYITLSDQSSCRLTAAQHSETRLLHVYPTARNNQVEPVDWSQHGEQGNFAHVSSISASLPPYCLKRGGEESPVRQVAPCNVDEDEKTWQRFVLGSDKDVDSETQSEHDGHGDQRTSKASRDISHLPLFASSTRLPFRPPSGMDACISDNVQDTAAAAFAPLSGSRSITPRSDGRNEELGQGEQSMASDKQQRVNDASLQNNASCDSHFVSPRRCSDIKMTRGSLSRRDYTSDGLSRRATAGRSELGQGEYSPSIHEILASSDSGLDLIDPDSFM